MRWTLHCLLPALLATTIQAQAGCSRPIMVPVAATGFSVIINGQTIGGIYPELMRDLASKGACQFALSPVPRARLEAMFENGKADLLIPATRTPRRDKLGYFVALALSRPTLMSIDATHAPVRSVQDLLDRRELRVALVRGYDYGDRYADMVKQLQAQGRLFMEVDPTSVARLLLANAADVTVMAPNILAGAIESDPRVVSMGPKLRIEPLSDFPWNESGVYISRTSVKEEDRILLERLFDNAARSGAVHELFKRYYRPEILTEGIRQR